MLDRSLPLLQERQRELSELLLKSHHLGFQADQFLDQVPLRGVGGRTAGVPWWTTSGGRIGNREFSYKERCCRWVSWPSSASRLLNWLLLRSSHCREVNCQSSGGSCSSFSLPRLRLRSLLRS